MGLKPFKAVESNTRGFSGWLAPDPIVETNPEEAQTFTEEVEGDPINGPMVEVSTSEALIASEETVEEEFSTDDSVESDEEEEMMSIPEDDDPLLHRPYYCCDDPRLEAINVITGSKMNFPLGSAYKYLIRAGRKTEDSQEDLEKAVWFLKYLRTDAESEIEMPTSDDIISGFNLDFYTGTAVENILQLIEKGDQEYLDKAIEVLERKLERMKG